MPTRCGGQYVTAVGVIMMPERSAINWDSQDLVKSNIPLHFPLRHFRYTYVEYIYILYIKFGSIAAASSKSDAFFGSGSGPVLLSSLQCNWYDTSIIECSSYDPSYCSHSDDAGVICEGRLLSKHLSHIHNEIIFSGCVLCFP